MCCSELIRVSLEIDASWAPTMALFRLQGSENEPSKREEGQI